VISPSSIRHKPIADDFRQSRSPGHLLDCKVLIDPGGGRYILAVNLDRRHARVDGNRGPQLASGAVDVLMRRHVGDEVERLQHDRVTVGLILQFPRLERLSGIDLHVIHRPASSAMT
jgi:hypothetical protein